MHQCGKNVCGWYLWERRNLPIFLHHHLGIFGLLIKLNEIILVGVDHDHDSKTAEIGCRAALCHDINDIQHEHLHVLRELRIEYELGQHSAQGLRESWVLFGDNHQREYLVDWLKDIPYICFT